MSEPLDDIEKEIMAEVAPDYGEPLALGAIMSGDFPRQPYIVADLIMQRLVNMLYANGGMGKTTTAIEMALAIAHGVKIFGRATIKSPVLL